jgi:predicted nuclease of predicted toxin-antitoxin system
VKLLVDMNLSPNWVEQLARHGFEAVHWSTIGAATAPDVEILTWANEHQFVVITNDLDFSSILAASAGATPSVVQVRTQDLLSDAVVGIVANALKVHQQDSRSISSPASRAVRCAVAATVTGHARLLQRSRAGDLLEPPRHQAPGSRGESAPCHA